MEENGIIKYCLSFSDTSCIRGISLVKQGRERYNKVFLVFLHGIPDVS